MIFLISKNFYWPLILQIEIQVLPIDLDIMSTNFDKDEEKLKWAFRLYDQDNNGVIDIAEMANIIDTLDSIEGVKPGDKTEDQDISRLV